MIIFQCISIFLAIILFKFPLYFFIGLGSAIFITISHFKRWKYEIIKKISNKSIKESLKKEAIKSSIFFTIIVNFIFLIFLWPAQMAHLVVQSCK